MNEIIVTYPLAAPQPLTLTPPRYIWMQMSCPPEGWKQREWITTREQPVVGARYALECTGVEEKDGLVHALFALCPLP